MFLFICFGWIFLNSSILFKYISCSYLSSWQPRRPLSDNIQIHLMFLFISGIYSLVSSREFIQIHLMFLFISLRRAIPIREYLYSNTSHVLIYRSRKGLARRPKTIQIHLMFLFITIDMAVADWGYIQIHLMFLFIKGECIKYVFCFSFKYISCSYLSAWNIDISGTANEFKYISCSYLSLS